MASARVLADPPRPFDFLVNNEFLRVSLGEYVEANGIYTVSLQLTVQPEAYLSE
jgi:hypothetical protein